MTSTGPKMNTPIKVYIDGFRIDNVDTPENKDWEAAALTPTVKTALEGKVVDRIVPVPSVNPKFILITTRL